MFIIFACRYLSSTSRNHIVFLFFSFCFLWVDNAHCRNRSWSISICNICSYFLPSWFENLLKNVILVYFYCFSISLCLLFFVLLLLLVLLVLLFFWFNDISTALIIFTDPDKNSKLHTHTHSLKFQKKSWRSNKIFRVIHDEKTTNKIF